MNNTKIYNKPWFRSVAGSAVIIFILFAFAYYYTTIGQIKTENASVVAPIINLSPMSMGTLEEVYVKVGDKVSPYTPIAKVGNEIITSKVTGIISSVSNTEGQVYQAGSPIASMINLEKERVVGQIDEDKGFADIKIGNPAVFTIDAFGTKQFIGVVDEISPTAHQGDIVFNISDKREIKQFDVKIKFDIEKYPELKNGMSARISIFK